MVRVGSPSTRIIECRARTQALLFRALHRVLRAVELVRQAPLPTSLDLYRELEAVTPAQFKYLLHDLFEVNTLWTMKTERAKAQPANNGAWQVTLDIRARKIVVDEAGVETAVPIDDWVDIGVFAASNNENELSKPLYVQKHRITSAAQTITITVPRKPERAGADPYDLLKEWGDEIVRTVKVES